MVIYFSLKCLEYNQPGHPESPQRILTTAKFLKEKGYTFIEPKPCNENDILRVHSKDMLMGIKKGTLYDGDTPPIPKIIEYAQLSAGSAILASEMALRANLAFSLMRPPGHHATNQCVMGFCYLNNIAIATAKYIQNNPKKRAAILDIDCHHGNGTEDIFYGHSGVLYVSLHQSPLYPGTGLHSRKNCINFPLPPRTREKEYLTALEKGCLEITDFNPSLLGISAGFDTYEDDPLTQLSLKTSTYRKLGQTIAQLSKQTFIVMEGGYSRDLPKCVFEFLEGVNI